MCNAGLEMIWRVVFPSGSVGLDEDFQAAVTSIYGSGWDSTGESVDNRMLHSWVKDRTSIEVPAGSKYSTGCYYNAFPAAYWAQWTNVQSVTLRLHTVGHGTISIYASDEKASERVIRNIEVNTTTGSAMAGVFADGDIFETIIPISGMADGGWLWFDVQAAPDSSLTVSGAQWLASVPAKRVLTASLSITTMNKPEWCIRQFNLLADMADMSLIDAVYVVDQGTKLVEDADGFGEAKSKLGDKLRVIRQGNIGGSGGFARGMYEVERHGESGYAMLLDDDTVLEPESVSRAIAFANHCIEPMLVGGNMLFLSEPTRICALAEVFDAKSISWGAAVQESRYDDLASESFLDKKYLHKRVDADYNAWWMCLIPVEVIRKIGLSYPFFIKNDDVEYGVRAQRAGYRTVTVPGVCLWHQSFADKDDQLDWQAYFHIRNRTIMGLLYTNQAYRNSVLKEMVRFTMSATAKMRYSAVALHQAAMKDIMAGPEHVGSILEIRLPEIREIRGKFDDAMMVPIEELPDVLRGQGKEFEYLHDASRASAAMKIGLHQLMPPRADRDAVIDGYMEPTKVHCFIDGEHRMHNVPAEQLDTLALVADDASDHWRAAGLMDSAVFVDPERGKGILLTRNPLLAISGFIRTCTLYVRLIANWRTYQKEYRKAFAAMVSPEWWQKYFGEE